MSLLKNNLSVDQFVKAGTVFLEQPSLTNAMAFDDARVALRDYVNVELKDVEISSLLVDLGMMIRQHETEQIELTFNQIVQMLTKQLSPD